MRLSSAAATELLLATALFVALAATFERFAPTGSLSLVLLSRLVPRPSGLLAVLLTLPPLLPARRALLASLLLALLCSSLLSGLLPQRSALLATLFLPASSVS